MVSYRLSLQKQTIQWSTRTQVFYKCWSYRPSTMFFQLEKDLRWNNFISVYQAPDSKWLVHCSLLLKILWTQNLSSELVFFPNVFCYSKLMLHHLMFVYYGTLLLDNIKLKFPLIVITKFPKNSFSAMNRVHISVRDQGNTPIWNNVKYIYVRWSQDTDGWTCLV